MKYICLIASLTIVATLVGCDIPVDSQHGFSSTDAEYMKNVETLLKKRGIPYTVVNGEIRYSTENHDQFEGVLKTLSSLTMVKFEEPEVRQFFRELLDSQGLEYIDRHKTDGIWIVWFPKDEKQSEELQMKVAEFAFSLKYQEQNKKGCERFQRGRTYATD